MGKKILIMFIEIVVLVSASIYVITRLQDKDQSQTIEQTQSENGKKEEKDMNSNKNTRKKFSERNQGESSKLAVSLNPLDNMHKEFSYEVTNESDKQMTIEFSTSQRYEVVLEKKGEGEVFRFSKGRAFMQVLGELKLKPSETESFNIKLPELQPGDYSLTIYLVGKGVSESSKRTMNFTIDG